MNGRMLFLGVFCTTTLLVFSPTVLGTEEEGKPRAEAWKQVEEAVKQGLPKTAIERLEPIIEGAMQDKAYAEAIKAISQRISLEGTIQGNKPEEKITRMRAEIAKAPPEMVPMLDAILANWYWHYFQKNRWRFMQRTETSEAPNADFTTWSLKRLLGEVDKQFTQALAAKPQLVKIPIAQYDALLEKGNAPAAYRPTLYDFLAHNALQFYSAGEQAGARVQEAFDLMADSPIFASADEFIAWKIETADTPSPTLKAIRLYQDLLRLHQADEDRSAFLDADLWRLQFGNNRAFGEEKAARYQAALKRFIEAHLQHPIAARAMHQLASERQTQGELVDAHQLATRGLKLFPNSVGGRRCFNLIQDIEAKSSTIVTERVWNDPLPVIQVRYRNVDKIYLRAVPYDFRQLLQRRAYRPENPDTLARQQLLAKKPVLAWSHDLPATEDYQERVEEIEAPGTLQAGFYFLISSHDPSFGDKDNVVRYTGIWVSKLALVSRTHYGAGKQDGFVLDALSGEPLPGATLQAWIRGRNNIRAAGPKTTTDKNGYFDFSLPVNQSYLLHVTYKDQQLSSAYDQRNYVNKPKTAFQRTVFFTDRSLYRPGQAIQYKGLCIDVNQQKDNYATLSQRDVTVVFADRNGKEIERRQHRSNDYGSFSGSFTAPRDRLLGRMRIFIANGPPGSTNFHVEEYKRPKFQVEVSRPEEAARLDGEVTVKGEAKAYTGAAIDGAAVRYRVVREVRYPDWWGWYYWWRTPRGNSQEIAHGSTTTAVDGSFQIKFVARPDRSVAAEDEPIFRYVVSADVTDTSGETRSGQTEVNVGYTALRASLRSEGWLTVDKPIPLRLTTQTLDGVGQKAEGIIRVYRLKQPAKVQRPRLIGRNYPRRGKQDAAPPVDLSNPNSWPLGDQVAEEGFATSDAGEAELSFKLEAGIYRALLETQDAFGKPVKARLQLQVLEPDATACGIRLPLLLNSPRWTLEPGQQFMALWGSGYERARAFVEVEHRQRRLQAFWTKAGQTQAQIRQAVTEGMRGGFTLHITMVRENRAYLRSQKINVPWSNKNLSIKWEHFVSKLKPDAEESWTAIITGPDAEKSVAEMVAALYDASLDAYRIHRWNSGFNVFRQDYANLRQYFSNTGVTFGGIHGNWPRVRKDGSLTYAHLPYEIIANLSGYQMLRRGFGRGGGIPAPAAAAPGVAEDGAVDAEAAPAGEAVAGKAASRAMAARTGAAPDQSPDLSAVSARKNLNETAFFFPHLISNKDGEVQLKFRMPEALTEWKFLGFAHDRDLRSALLEDKVVTSKDLMVQPNPPRFVREGDILQFTVKVTNQSPTSQTGKVRLTLADARTGDPLDDRLGNEAIDLPFEIPAKQSASLAWELTIPDDIGFLTYKTVGSTGRLSDGEEGYLPVLSKRILVTESITLPIRGAKTKEFEFEKLRKSGQSETLRNKTLTVQMVSNPSWYAVMALPYLMEFPHECTEQTFNRLYANSLARHLAKSDPKIRAVFEQWKGTDALDSPLEKNEDLKAVMVEETPWLRQAQRESQARRNVGILFDDNRLAQETSRNLMKLVEMQHADGAWPWFPGGPANDYITLYITTGFGRMRHLGVDVDTTAAVKSLKRLDDWVDRTYRKIKERDRNHLTPTIALYLYGRSFFLEDQAVAKPQLEAVNYFLGQAKQYWLQLANRQSQAHLAVALHRFGDRPTAQAIMKSIKERSVSDQELGMFWRELELSWWWYRAPVETQAMMIEAFDEVMNDAQAVEDCKIWLLKQKQTQDWKTTKATADAVYALLLRGDNLLASHALVEVALGGQTIKPEKAEAGTGFYETRFLGGDIKPRLGKITVTKKDPGVAWGSVHWQYLEDMSKITPHEGTPLKLKKALYTKVHTDQGPVLKPVEGALHVGDELVVRVELRVDRDMEYVHLKDYRGSGTEPVNVLSQYKYQDGLAYYESTRDSASHFFIDYLPKGVYVFEYSTRIQLRGKYQTGIAQIQCMYAPEFNSHSESLLIEVN